VSAGKYPPPVNVLSGIAGYLEDITAGDSESLFVEYDERKKAGESHKEAFAAAEATVQRVVALAGDEVAWHKDPTPTFKSVYAALVQFHLTEWLFPADDPANDEGISKRFAPYKTISEAEEDDDDSEDTLEEDEEDDDEADSYE